MVDAERVHIFGPNSKLIAKISILSPFFFQFNIESFHIGGLGMAIRAWPAGPARRPAKKTRDGPGY